MPKDEKIEYRVFGYVDVVTSWKALPDKTCGARKGTIFMVAPYYKKYECYAVYFNGEHWEIFGYRDFSKEVI